MKRDEHFEALLMKAVDDVLSADEQRELEAWLAEDPSRAEELASFQRVKEVTDQMTERMMKDVQIEPFREGAMNRFSSWTAFLWIFGGLFAALGWASMQFFFDPNVPAAIRFGLFFAAAGSAFLFGRILWVRIRAAGRDPYEEIDR